MTDHDIVPYSQLRAFSEPWPIERLVEAQRMECAGCSYEDIAEALGANIEDVRARLAPSEALSARRPERANVGHQHLKR